ncbi:hypothetical protein HY346_00575 [Candidatus Microgenomates bacterium]|nr:hypothetical protein [Candidatus Microgenomates bacterium]
MEKSYREASEEENHKTALLGDLNAGYVWCGLNVYLPPEPYEIIMSSKNFQEDITQSLSYMFRGNGYDGELSVDIRMKFIEVEKEWKEKIRKLISEYNEVNQGIVTEKVFHRKSRQPIIYNEMKFASKAEVSIAQELEERRILFFPLPLAVRSDTGARYLDHREPDFLICHDGVWGILEIAHHQGRYEKDSEKDIWFKQSGILCIQHYTAERCYSSPADVVSEFLGILAKFKR